MEGDAGDGPGGVAANSRQVKELREIGGDLAGVFLEDGAGGGVEVSGAAVVAKAGPELEDFLKVGLGEVFDGRERL